MFKLVLLAGTPMETSERQSGKINCTVSHEHKKSGEGDTVLLARQKGLATGRTKTITEKHILVMREGLSPVPVS